MAQLKKFKEKYGHCNPADTEKDFPGLEGWCQWCRFTVKLKKWGNARASLNLPDRKERMLRDIGFVFDDDD